MKKINLILILVLSILTAMECRAGGFIITNPPGHGSIAPERLPSYLLESKSLKVNVDINGQYAKTSIDQVFYNPSGARLEGYFLFPAPKGASIKDFSMDINGKQMQAELLDAKKARKIYEDIVRQMRDPALLEYSEQALFRMRIFPIEPRSDKRIKITYTELLEKDNNTVEYVFPLNTKKYSGKPLNDIAMKINVETPEDIKTIYSPSHEVEIIRKKNTEAVVGYEAKQIKPENDFKLFIGTNPSKIGMSLLSYKKPDEEGFFFLDISPGFAAGQDEIVNKDITFVLDVSGSMAGEKIEQAKKALNFCIDNLNENDRFEIIKFSTEAQAVFEKRMQANSANIKKAKAFVKKMKAIGGTNIDEALSLALKEKAAANRPHMIVFMTDGKPTIGETEEGSLVKNIESYNTGNTRIFTFGIGFDINTHLLDKITALTKAYRSYITPDEDIEMKISGFYEKVSSPVLTDVKISFASGVKPFKMFPKDLPDIFKGSSLNILGRYENAGKTTIKLEGTVNGRTETFTYAAELNDDNEKYDFIPPLWAARNIGYLLDQIRLHGESTELVNEITDLAKTYGIITPYTSYLILEDERIDISRRRIAPDRVIFNNRAMDDEGFMHLNETTFFEMDKKDGGAGVQASKEVQDMNMATNQAAIRGSRSITYIDKTGQQRDFSQQVRNIQGRAVYQNGNEWIDLNVQTEETTKTNRIQFAGKEYFELLNNQPQVSQFLSLGNNVRFIYNNELYEIYE